MYSGRKENNGRVASLVYLVHELISQRTGPLRLQ